MIVHNAGRVDAAYIRRSGSSEALGSKIEISAQQISEYLRGVEVAGGAVLGGINSWLAGEERPPGTVPDDQTAPA